MPRPKKQKTTEPAPAGADAAEGECWRLCGPGGRHRLSPHTCASSLSLTPNAQHAPPPPSVALAAMPAEAPAPAPPAEAAGPAAVAAAPAPAEANADADGAAQPVKQKKKRDNNPGIRVQGGRIYDSEKGTTCHQVRRVDGLASAVERARVRPSLTPFIFFCAV